MSKKTMILGTLLSLILIVVGLNINAKSSSQLVLSEDNTLVLNTDVNDTIVAELTEKALKMDEDLPSDEPIYLVLNTPGGSIVSGLELIDNLKSLDRKVHTLTVFAASMGFQIAQNLNERLMVSRGQLMSHRARGTVANDTEFGGSEPSQTSSRIAHWTRVITELDEVTVKRTKGLKTLEQYRKEYDDELWLTAALAVKEGYADKIVNAVCDSSLSGTSEIEVSFMGLPITLVISKCPLITGLLDVKIGVRTRDGRVLSHKEFINKGGKFGNECLSTNITQLCPADITLTAEKLESIKEQIRNKYTNIKVITNYGVL